MISLAEKGNELYKQGVFREAFEFFGQIIEIAPRYAKAWYNRGVIFGKIGEYLEAIENYDKTVR